ncbi:cobyric acid synthase, partial [Candidatus Poribacteria bacterium]
LRPGLRFLEERTGKPVLGVVPYVEGLRIQEEDSVTLERPKVKREGEVKVAVVKLPHISNFTDFDPLEAEEDVSLVYATSPDELEDADIIILPGTKNTMRDLIWLREKGFARKLLEARGKGKLIIGICGGFQMLGRRIADPFGVESGPGEIEGLGLLDAITVFEKEKATYQVVGEVVVELPFLEKGREIRGYEIHMGRTEGEGFVFKLRRSTGGTVYDGMISRDGLAFGTYLHGIFDDPVFRRGVLNFVRKRKGLKPIEPKGIDPRVERAREYDRLAEIVRRSVDIEAIYRLMGL